MVLRKITIDNSVKYVPINEKTLNKTQQKIKNKVKNFNIFQEKVNKTKIVQKTKKKILEKCCSKWIFYTYKIKKTYSCKYNNKYVNIHI